MAEGNIQEQKTTIHSVKAETPSTILQKEEEKSRHTFRINLNYYTYAVSCKPSMTVLEAINTNKTFRDEQSKNKNMQKELIIQRSKRKFPRASVKTDFPCCLIEKDEILDIAFKKKRKEEEPNVSADSSLSKSNPETLVTFWVKKDGGTNVRLLLKSDVLRMSVGYVCVWAFKGENIETALKRDGRFSNVIFDKHCGLSKFSETRYELSMPVDDLDRKAFQVVVISDKNQPDGQEDWTAVNDESDVSSEEDMAEKPGPSQDPIITEPEKNKQTENTTKPTDSSTKRCTIKPIKNSEDLLGFLHVQYENLVKTLKQRENLKNNSDVQKFFRAEFSKSVENFSEVKKVKQLMTLSNSVCQIRKGGSALGSGFLLINRFILTNAHVIGIFTDLTNVNFAEFTAVFNYEDLDSEVKPIPVKQLIAYFYGKDESGCHLDYALLELDDTSKTLPDPLFKHYSANSPIDRGQICIVGHPGEGVKKMDPCIIIERENREEAAEKHAQENCHLIHTINDVWQKEKSDILSACDNKITYDSCFFHGSSGSPVFDRDCHLIGIHTGGYVYGNRGKKTLSVMEYGYSMQPILAHSITQAKIKGFTEYVKKLEEKPGEKKEMEIEELFTCNFFNLTHYK